MTVGQIQIRAIGELFTVNRQVAPGAKSAVVGCLVKFATRCYTESCSESYITTCV